MMIQYHCRHCRGTGIVEKPAAPLEIHSCFVLHRQYGINKKCLRADAGFSGQCDQPYPGVPKVPDGRCPIAAVEDQRKAEDAWVQAMTILRNCGKDPMEALRAVD